MNGSNADTSTKTPYTALEAKADHPTNSSSTPTVDGVAVAVPPPVVDVVAPADMPAGYQFSVDFNGQHLLVKVPEGGVKEGQQFRAAASYPNGSGGGALHGHNIPVGSWRDGLFDCCKHGCCHPQFWLSFFFTPIALGQLMTRMQLDWTASPVGSRHLAWSAFKVILVAFIIYQGLDNFLYYMTYQYTSAVYDPDTGMYTPPENVPVWASSLDAVRSCLSLIYGLSILILTIRTRQYIRTKYSIPENGSCCPGCEDCCVSFWCGCCSVCQMARHTADYNQYNASCCTETGLDPTAPLVV